MSPRSTISDLPSNPWRATSPTGPKRPTFYFCGHGMGKGTDLALLAADYGASVNDPLNAAIDFRNLLA